MPSAATTTSAARPASESIWFAPGAADLLRLPERAQIFEEVWDGIKNRGWPTGGKPKKPSKGGNQVFVDLALQRHREQEAILDEIRTQGFVWGGGDDEDGTFIPAFTEIGKRTAVAGGHVVRRLVTLIGKRPESGTGKGAVTKQLRKEAALFDDYVVLNSRVRGVIRVDNDAVWKSWADVHSWLVSLLKEGKIPCLPHLAVCKRSADGTIRKPHFLILLGVGDEVSGDGRHNGATRGLMRGVEYGWIRALSGDMGGALNSRKIKNPLSPRMQVGIFNQTTYLNLTEMAETLDCSHPDYRRMAADNAGLDVKRSNSVFDDTRERAYPKVAQMRDLGDPRYQRWLDNEDDFIAGLSDVLLPGALLRHSGDKPAAAIEKIVMAVCVRLAQCWDPEKGSPPPDRGVMQLPPDMPLEGEGGKWEASGKWSSRKRMCETIEMMADDIDRIESSGRAARRSDLINDGWAETTVKRRFDAAVLLSYYRGQPVEGKKGTDPTIKTAMAKPANIPSDLSSEPAIQSPSIVADPSSTDAAEEPAIPNPSLPMPTNRSFALVNAGENAMSALLDLPRNSNAGTTKKTEASEAKEACERASSRHEPGVHALLPEKAEIYGITGSSGNSRSSSATGSDVFERLARISRKVGSKDAAEPVSKGIADETGFERLTEVQGEADRRPLGQAASGDAGAVPFYLIPGVPVEEPSTHQ